MVAWQMPPAEAAAAHRPVYDGLKRSAPTKRAPNTSAKTLGNATNLFEEWHLCALGKCSTVAACAICPAPEHRIGRNGKPMHGNCVRKLYTELQGRINLLRVAAPRWLSSRLLRSNTKHNTTPSLLLYCFVLEMQNTGKSLPIHFERPLVSPKTMLENAINWSSRCACQPRLPKSCISLQASLHALEGGSASMVSQSLFIPFLAKNSVLLKAAASRFAASIADSSVTCVKETRNLEHGLE